MRREALWGALERVWGRSPAHGQDARGVQHEPEHKQEPEGVFHRIYECTMCIGHTCICTKVPRGAMLPERGTE